MHGGQRTFDGSQHVGHRDLGRGPGQLVSPVGPATGADDARSAQLREDVLEEVLRNRLAPRELLPLDGNALVLDGGELRRRSHRVVGLGCDPHGLILADPGAGREMGLDGAVN